MFICAHKIFALFTPNRCANLIKPPSCMAALFHPSDTLYNCIFDAAIFMLKVRFTWKIQGGQSRLLFLEDMLKGKHVKCYLHSHLPQLQPHPPQPQITVVTTHAKVEAGSDVVT